MIKMFEFLEFDEYDAFEELSREFNKTMRNVHKVNSRPVMKFEDYCKRDCEQTRLTFEQYSKTAKYLTHRYRVIVNDGATILFDNRTDTKTIVKKAKDDKDDIEKSILWAFLKSQGYSTKDLNIFANTYDDKRTKKVKKDKK